MGSQPGRPANQHHIAFGLYRPGARCPPNEADQSLAVITPESSYSGQRPLGLTAATTARNCSKVI